MNESLVSELAAMAAADQRVRQPPPGSVDRFSRPLSMEDLMEITRTDVGNADRLREIIEFHGWPGRALVGDEGAEHAWLIAQHADRQLDFQRWALERLTDAVGRRDAPATQLAYLTDRVRVNEGREQVYGTQIGDVQDGRAVPMPVEDPARLDARRAEVGLPPFDDYAAEFAA